MVSHKSGSMGATVSPEYNESVLPLRRKEKRAYIRRSVISNRTHARRGDPSEGWNRALGKLHERQPITYDGRTPRHHRDGGVKRYAICAVKLWIMRSVNPHIRPHIIVAFQRRRLKPRVFDERVSHSGAHSARLAGETTRRTIDMSRNEPRFPSIGYLTPQLFFT